MFPLRLLLHRFVRRGHLERYRPYRPAARIRDTWRRFRQPPSGSTIQLFIAASLFHPTLHVGRAYVDGTLTIAEGQLSDFLNLLLINEHLASQDRGPAR